MYRFLFLLPLILGCGSASNVPLTATNVRGGGGWTAFEYDDSRFLRSPNGDVTYYGPADD